MRSNLKANPGSIALLIAILMTALQCLAAQPTPPGSDPSSLSSFVQFGLDHSLDRSAARMELNYQQRNETTVNRSRLIPQIGLSASYQRFYYDNLFPTVLSDGTLGSISNNGQNPSVGLVISYDLQKLFGPDSELAKQSTEYAKLQEKITTRDIVRNIKKNYFTLVEIQNEIGELNHLISRFDQIDNVLQKQKRIGVYNELERRQFRVQQSILKSDLQAKQSDLDAVYAQLSTLINVDVKDLKNRIAQITQKPELFADRVKLDPEQISKMKDQEMFDNLSQDYYRSKLEYEKFNSLPLPSVYVKGSRSVSTVPSSDGPQVMAEVGISFPLDSFFIRPAQKSQLGAKADKAQTLSQKAFFDYRNQIILGVNNLNRFKTQTESLKQTQKETEKLLDKTFLFYSQKRIDVLGALDIFQKYLLAARNSYVNELQIEMTDAELEYLMGGAST